MRGADVFLSELPQNEDYGRIVSKFPMLEVPLRHGSLTVQPTNTRALVTTLEVQDWEKVVIHKFYEARLGFVLMEHVYELGIPDEEWLDVETGTLQPHFSNDHHLRKLLFDYYSDSLSAKIFSTLESIGQLLFVMYGLTPPDNEKISFRVAVKQLRAKDSALNKKLFRIWTSRNFKRFLEYRHNATHNYPENMIGPQVYREGKTVHFGIGSYTTSKEVRQIVFNGFFALNSIIEAIKVAALAKHT